jgi:aminodeoxyfutalosine deaminase
MDITNFTQQLPKAELHVHLEGSIRPETLLILAERNGISLPFQDAQSSQEFYRFRNFSHFLEVYVTVTQCLRTADDYALIAYEFGRQCSWQNIRYAEVTFSMISNMHYSGLPWQTILEALNAGRAQASAEFGLHWQWVFDIVRNSPAEQDELLEIALAAASRAWWLGLGGAGPNSRQPCSRHLRTGRARPGLPAPTPGKPPARKCWDAIELLHADRLGHGVRSIENQRWSSTCASIESRWKYAPPATSAWGYILTMRNIPCAVCGRPGCC